ncbi:RNA-directed DNA polymerase (reverse transcriptase)-related family protein [Rhynchospora pubera]|uniref:RNA-directed DNA polymerase (Reverse transcriptase)-related family protein n=1 Tax=Rhynchospora pubera TaxID=906938 RepID=A0AAV8G5V3_9POAL|nr:RNA-directed DNA polymerase (reverse transcriptase)-related family protein [Rhynchospora pubera]
MNQLNTFIDGAHLLDVPLEEKRFTWSNKQPIPVMSRLDRVLLSGVWNSHYPLIKLLPLATVVSDHTPLLLKCRQLTTIPKPFRMELFWLHNEHAQRIIHEVWQKMVFTGQPLHSFNAKTINLHKALREWHVANFSMSNVFHYNAQQVVHCLDSLEELRQLTPLEIHLRILGRQRAFQLASISESRWRQRSRARWLNNGDRNTKYFHALASSRNRAKHVSKLLVQGAQLTDFTRICDAFTSYYIQLLGTEANTSSFDPAALYTTPDVDLSSLASPFTRAEIKRAVFSLSNDKCSGPDGVPNEFYKLNWDLVKQNLFDIFSSLFNGTLDLQSSNIAHIVLLPKEQHACTLSAFRPISVIAYIPKLISKVLANRLAAFIPLLIPESQTGFVRGRFIAENFIVAREMAFTVQKQSEPAFILKLDFKKAFDSVAWPFLMSVLRRRAFPVKFLYWLHLMLSTASSSILLNGRLGPSFQHKRGLRQGDPISPFLFNLAVDVLSRMLQAASLTVPHCISDKLQQPFFLLQYADDTMIFSTAKGTAVHVLNSVIHAFSLASGIELNLSKSALLTFNLLNYQEEAVQATLQVPTSSLPLTYLGLPLTVRRPDRLAYQTLIDKVQGKLAGWKSSLLSRAGRVVLAASVLSTIPVYFMTVFKLPVWVIKSLDRIRRNFVWGSSNNTGGSVHLLSWDRVCLPKTLGGFGLRDLRLQNVSLLLRWWWRLYHDKNSLWNKLATVLYGKRNSNIPPLAWNKCGSFFWHDLFSIRALFQVSTYSVIGSGVSTLFWFNNWGGGFQYFFNSLTKPPVRSAISVRSALQDFFKLLPAPLTLQQSCLLQQVQSISFSTAPDDLLWRWSSQGEYTAASAYNSFMFAGKRESPLKFVWKLKVPPSVKLFIILLAHGRLLTQDQLVRRNINCVQGCILCGQSECENGIHLFFTCTYSSCLWQALGVQISSAHLDTAISLQDMVMALFTPAFNQRSKLVLIATTFWGLWLERNNRTFRHQRRRLGAIQDWIISESTLFMKFC